MANNFLSLFGLMACFVFAFAGMVVKRQDNEGPDTLQGNSEQKMLINRLTHRLLDAVELMYKDLGASEEEIGAMKRKRGYVIACYFSSVTCY